MKMTLGGKLSIFFAGACAATWATALYLPDAYYFQDYTIYLLSFPLGWLSGMFSHTESGPPSELYLYLLLLIPNAFLLGYLTEGVITLIRLCRRPRVPPSSVASEEEFGKLLSEHRKHDPLTLH